MSAGWQVTTNCEPQDSNTNHTLQASAALDDHSEEVRCCDSGGYVALAMQPDVRMEVCYSDLGKVSRLYRPE